MAKKNNDCCAGINNKSYALTALAVFVGIFFTDFLIHGVLLKSTYQATQHLWRSESEMPSLMGWMLLGQVLIAASFTRLFVHGYQGKGLREGFCFGIQAAFLFAGNNLIMYAVAPWPLGLVLSWIGISIVQSALLGILAARLYRK